LAAAGYANATDGPRASRPEAEGPATFELLASGKDATVRAEGSAPGVPFDAKTETVSYAGEPPNLVAFRRKNMPCLVRDDATVLTLRGTRWREKRLPRREGPPHAFIPWDGGALLVDSQIQPCGWATRSPVERLTKGEGTRFTHVASTGRLSHPMLGLDPTFMAWGASSAGGMLALVGTYGVNADAEATGPGSRDIVVMRGRGPGSFRPFVIVKSEGPQTQSVRTRVRELGTAALVWPPPARDDGTPVAGAIAEGGDEIAWKGHASSVFRIDDHGIGELRFRSTSEPDCFARDAAVIGQDVYVIVACPTQRARLVRASAHGEPEPVMLPSPPTLGPCSPTELAPRTGDGLWVRAECGPESAPVSAVFRPARVQGPPPPR
jgi:hypothetical protein